VALRKRDPRYRRARARARVFNIYGFFSSLPPSPAAEGWEDGEEKAHRGGTFEDDKRERGEGRWRLRQIKSERNLLLRCLPKDTRGINADRGAGKGWREAEKRLRVRLNTPR